MTERTGLYQKNHYFFFNSIVISPPSAGLVFTLLYTPCVAAMATIRRELNSTVKTAGVVLMQCAVAWCAAFIAYAAAGGFV